jgi:hypothetical protein
MALIIVDGEVGGVGKSFTSCGLGEYLIAKGLPFEIIEADTKSNVADYFRDAHIPIHRADLTVTDGWLELLSILAKVQTAEVILSMPAGANTQLDERGSLLSIAATDLKRQTAIVWMLDNSPEGTSELARAAKTLKGSPIKFVAAMNAGKHGGTFDNWLGTETQKRVKPLEITVPKMQPLAVNATFKKFPRVRFSANGDSMDYGPRVECMRWLSRFNAEIDRVAVDLGIGAR